MKACHIPTIMLLLSSVCMDEGQDGNPTGKALVKANLGFSPNLDNCCLLLHPAWKLSPLSMISGRDILPLTFDVRLMSCEIDLFEVEKIGNFFVFKIL